MPDEPGIIAGMFHSKFTDLKKPASRAFFMRSALCGQEFSDIESVVTVGVFLCQAVSHRYGASEPKREESMYRRY